MLTQTDATIFLSGNRGIQQRDGFRSYRHFYAGESGQPGNNAFGTLYVLNDDTLAGSQFADSAVEEDSLIFIIPIVGKLQYSDSLGRDSVVEAGSCHHVYLSAGTRFKIHNPYEEELINYLQVWFRIPLYNGDQQPKINSFDMDELRNRLVNIFTAEVLEFPKLSIGKFTGRNEGIYPLASASRGLYCLVIEGAFEVAYRLLEARDGLALWNSFEVEYEALSNDAIVLMIEVPYPSPYFFKKLPTVSFVTS